ncbi:spermatogenesis-associated protein 1 [Ambystoma mexicanum]|uniref:spermatogenesis-associated protein 1 n=1 Tax=Ambystoma mexicanum TaxID=8296 RepID=UPI0037E95FCF
MRLRELRERLGEFLWEDVVADTFLFLKCMGRSLAVVKRKQEKELKLKSFAPPYALQPELYILPGVDHIDSIPALSPVTQLYDVVTPDPQRFNSVVPDIQHYSAVTEAAHRYDAPVSDRHPQNAVFPETHQHNVEVARPYAPPQWPTTSSPVNPAKTLQVHIPTRDENPKKAVKEDDAFNWTNMEKETIPTLTQRHVQREERTKITAENPLLSTRKGDIPAPVGYIPEQRSEQTFGRKGIGRNTTGDSGIPESLTDRDLNYAQKKKRQEKDERTAPVSYRSKTQDDEVIEKERHFSPHPAQYLSPPAPPLLTISTNKVKEPTFQTERDQLIEQLKQMKEERRHFEKTREDLVKKAKGLLEQNKLRRNHARDGWKKKYFETKKITAFLEEKVNKLRHEFELYYQKLLTQLEARDVRERAKHPTLAVNSKNNMIIQATIKQHEIEQLRRKLDNTKMKLMVEIKMRRQAASDLRALRAELAQKKIQSSLSTQPRISVM